MNVTPVNPNALDAFWEQLEPLVQKVIPTTYGRETTKSIRTKIKDQSLVLWIMWDDIKDIKGIVCTKIMEYPDKKVCWLGYMAAKDNQIDRWFIHGLSVLHKYWKLNDCHYVEFLGRKGWLKQFNKSKIKLTNIGTVYEGKIL